MRAHPWVLVGGFGVTVAAAIAVGQVSRLGGIAVLALAAVGWFMSLQCSHRYATLLPPVRDAGPDRDHARWYCDQCGKTWDSRLEPSTRPRVIFDGYDENMAIRASARADSLDRQRRRLANKRAGSNRRQQQPVVTHARGPRPVESVLDQRAVGFGDSETARPFAAMRRQ